MKDRKDPYTNGHSIRVAKYTSIIAEELGYKGEELEMIKPSEGEKSLKCD